MNIKPIFLVLIVLFSSCNTSQSILNYKPYILKGRNAIKLTSQDYQSWQHKDPLQDTIPGISSDKLYKKIDSIMPSVTPKKIVVAVLDSGIEIEHEDLQGSIWINRDEIPDNGIDDDNNGYVDDIHGWNFLGNSKGENVSYANAEYLRILKSNRIVLQDTITPKNLDSITSLAFYTFKKAKKELLADEKYIRNKKNEYYQLKKFFLDTYKLDTISIKSLSTIDTIGDIELKSKVDRLSKIYKRNRTETWIRSFEKFNSDDRDYKLNPEYDDRILIGDDVTNISDITYGNNNVKPNSDEEYHGTMVAGVIAANRNNNLGIQGVTNCVEIMSLRIVPKGDEYDKDVALAIRYAVDNGARVINMSFGKRFSPNKEFVFNAIKYAAKKDVLIFQAAGNDGVNLDKEKFYPDDNIGFGEEFSQNYVKVGASNQRMDLKLPWYYSNYGKRNVDIFAPGYKIYSTTTNNQYDSQSGTSLATPIASGAAALLMSYFPKFSALQIKEILFESGNNFDLIVRPPGLEDDRVDFSGLSVTGKTLNVYNAFILAKQLSKEKK